MEVFQKRAVITRHERLAPDIHRLTAEVPEIAAGARPGQFVMVKTAPGHDPLLRRPFSIHQVIPGDEIQLLYKVVGRGTELLAGLGEGRVLDIVGPLGRGFAVEPGPPVCLVGGGIGMAPLSFLARELRPENKGAPVRVLVGARNRQELHAVAGDLETPGIEMVTATDDGSAGHHGLVIDLMEALATEISWRVYACGPLPMLRAVAHFCRRRDWRCQVSLETVMACGIAACLGCTVRKAGDDGYLHVCKEGPVFNAEEVAWT